MKTKAVSLKTTTNERPKTQILRTSVTLPAVLGSVANDRIDKGGYTSFSDYIQDLIRQDARQHSLAA